MNKGNEIASRLGEERHRVLQDVPSKKPLRGCLGHIVVCPDVEDAEEEAEGPFVSVHHQTVVVFAVGFHCCCAVLFECITFGDS